MGPRPDLVEKRMFGGMAFLIDGKMSCGVNGERMMARIDKARFDEALGEAHVSPMDFTGRPMRGFVYLEKPGWTKPQILKRWVDESIAVAQAAT